MAARKIRVRSIALCPSPVVHSTYVPGPATLTSLACKGIVIKAARGATSNGLAMDYTTVLSQNRN